MASPKTKSNAPRIALVGGETLLGREIAEVFKSRSGNVVITPYAATGEGNFDEEDGEAVYREPLEAKSIQDERAVLIAGTSQGARKAFELVKAAGGKPLLMDCTGQLDQQTEAKIVAPLAEENFTGPGWLYVLAHPAATAILLVLRQLARHEPIRHAILTIFEPASERGKKGASELHQQTTSLLAFKPLEKKVFDTQVAFNLLAAYGEDAPESLIASEQRIERHLATLLSRQKVPSVPMPSIRLIQAPVFHSYSISAWVEFESPMSAAPLAEALASAQIEVRDANQETPGATDAAGQSGLIAGDIRVDRNNPRAAWIWIVADNLRLTADAAADLLTALEVSK
ncbi:MAG TPA: Asd/ArgC dimerization domain-containing protein [Bryobacteraceae bacterium]|nr:Asd/ArgC dimerization domain-containing protein [Bryobacteraceae bacterium]